MEYEEVLLIGGPCDGRRMSVMAGVPVVQVAVPGTPPTSLLDPSPPMCQEIQHPVYQRCAMHGPLGFVGAVYVADGIDPVAALIAGYRQPK